MIKGKNLLFFLTLLLGLGLGFLTIGKCTRVVITTSDNREISYSICRGELVGESKLIDADVNISTEKLLEKANSSGEDRTYFDANVFNKGYTNNQVVSSIKNHLEPKGAKVTREDKGLMLIGFRWIIHKFSSK